MPTSVMPKGVEHTNATRHEIDSLILENDLGALADLLCEYEDNDQLRELLYAAIDRVVAKLVRVVTIDELLTI